jgi:2-dehydropantoate 2-reductase
VGDYVVYGAGAVGGVIGGLLHRAGHGTTLVARGAHLEAMRTSGLTLDAGDIGPTVLHPELASGAAEVDWSTSPVVLLAVKSHQAQAALDDLAGHAPPETVVVCATNGVATEREALRRFASTYAVCVMLPTTHLKPGVVVAKCHPTPGILDCGRIPTGVDAVAEQVSADLRSAGFESRPRADIMAWKHRKLLMNLGNGVDASCRPGPDADRLADLAVAEGEAVLAAAGIPVVTAEEDRERRGDHLRRREGAAPAGGSTWQSVTRGSGSTEIDYLAGEIVLLGRLHGVPTRACEAIQRATARLAREGGAARSLDAADLLPT